MTSTLNSAWVIDPPTAVKDMLHGLEQPVRHGLNSITLVVIILLFFFFLFFFFSPGPGIGDFWIYCSMTGFSFSRSMEFPKKCKED